MTAVNAYVDSLPLLLTEVEVRAVERVSPSFVRLELGAGLIKLRGDRCWRDLTCLEYHHETQPLPGPTSRFFHHLPRPLHRAEVLANHVRAFIAGRGA